MRKNNAIIKLLNDVCDEYINFLPNLFSDMTGRGVFITLSNI